MDDFTQRILAQVAEFAEHPERYTVTLHCPDCGQDRTATYPKDAVSRHVTETGSNIVRSRCNSCAPADDEDDD